MLSSPNAGPSVRGHFDGVYLVSCLATLLCLAQSLVPSRRLDRDRNLLPGEASRVVSPIQRERQGRYPHVPSAISYGELCARAPRSSGLAFPSCSRTAFADAGPTSPPWEELGHPLAGFGACSDETQAALSLAALPETFISPRRAI